VYRKIFGMNKWETVKCVQMFCERLDFIRIFHKHNLKFFNSLFCMTNHIVSECFLLLRRSRPFQNLCNEHDVVVDTDSLHFNVYNRFLSLCNNF